MRPNEFKEIKLYNQWKRLIEKRKLNVKFEIGEKIGIERIFYSAKIFITTSVAEGFGLAFFEPWLYSKPIIGRDLPEITNPFCSNFGIDFQHLYPVLPIPVDLINIDDFKNVLFHKRKIFMNLYLKKSSKQDQLETFKAAIYNKTFIDFGRLDVTNQIKVIEKISSISDKSILPIRTIEQLIPKNEIVIKNKAAIEKNLGIEAYFKRLLVIYKKVASSVPSSVNSYADASVLLNHFLKPSNFICLRML